MSKVYDVIVVGGGINGSSIAFHLAKRGYKVTVIEQGKIAGKASGAAAGILGAQTELTEDGPLFQLARQSRAMFPDIINELEELSGVQIGYQSRGVYKVASTENHAQKLKTLVHLQTNAGEKAEWLNIEELKRRESAISNTLLGAMYIPEDGQVQAYEFSLAFARAAMTLGAEFYEYTSVHDFLIKDEKVQGVQTSQGDLLSDSVIVAAGAWSSLLLEKTGLTLPVFPVKGECFSVISQKQLVKATIFSDDCYIVPKKSGRLIVGATVKPNTFDEKVSFGGISALMEKAIRLLPDIANAEWVNAWAGIRPISGDGLPFLGEHPNYKQLYIATGHFRNGILLAPVTGKLIADYIDGNRLDIKSFDLSRINSKFTSIKEGADEFSR
ncbi:glycine oxidase ThiO [Cytobacillus purgationiresistens]|uniref:glycine oxidase n=1 Tax=Cytobacillus purgationiresistens TaxID=863449 RepID=A0ABU0ACS4_9BACI|nr:glycine oxidase ThiO [Cytobacillus purgationiresistens]MDQ0268233.1 glycine oxidase [Cytobacillus purgationiresistens]